ncbi:MAG: helix-turn-helix domain-containing protein [Saccharofermentanales bacterium]
MYKNERRWHWIFTGKEFRFADEKFPFAIVRFVHNQNENPPLHRHGFIELVFVLDGSAMHYIKVPGLDGYECRISKGDVFIINPEEEHNFSFDENEKLDILNINFQSSFIDGTLIQGRNEVRIMDFLYLQPALPLNVRFGNILKLSENEMQNIIAQVDNIVLELKEKDIGYMHMISLYMALIFTLLSRKYISAVDNGMVLEAGKDHSMSNIFRVMGYVEHHYSEDITKEELSRIGMCSVRNLSRKFKECTGETVIEYIHRLRIDKSRRLLIETDRKVTDIAVLVGFNDISFFNKTFKKRMNTTPREYREKNKRVLTARPKALLS